MPPKNPKPKHARRAPRAPKKKLLVHAFYLLQPFVQFVALIAVMVILARCSPLASSTDKVSGAKLTPALGDQNTSLAAEALAEEEEIQKNFHELGAAELALVSESEQAKLELISVEQPLNESKVNGVFDLKNIHMAHARKAFSISLKEEQRQSLAQEHYVRVELSALMSEKTKEKARKIFFKRLALFAARTELNGSAQLVLPDATMQQQQAALGELKQKIKISLSVPSDEKAYLQLELVEIDPAQAQNNATLLNGALEEAVGLSVLLE